MSNRSGRTATVRKSNGAILEARTASPAPVPLVLPRAGAPMATVSREVNVVDRYVDFRHPQARNPPPAEPPANVKAARPLAARPLVLLGASCLAKLTQPRQPRLYPFQVAMTK